MTAMVIVSVVFAVVIAVVVLRFMFLARQLVDSVRMDFREHTAAVDAARSAAFMDAMTALGDLQGRLSADQERLLERTIDAVAGPQAPPAAGGVLAVDDPALDARPRWMPDDEFDYTGLGIDPTDDDMPLPRLEPDGNAHRAVMVRPGEGLAPG